MSGVVAAGGSEWWLGVVPPHGCPHPNPVRPGCWSDRPFNADGTTVPDPVKDAEADEFLRQYRALHAGRTASLPPPTSVVRDAPLGRPARGMVSRAALDALLTPAEMRAEIERLNKRNKEAAAREEKAGAQQWREQGRAFAEMMNGGQPTRPGAPSDQAGAYAQGTAYADRANHGFRGVHR